MKITHVTIANADLSLTVRSAAKRFGGCTGHETLGAWTDDRGKLIIEPGIRITIAGHDPAHVLAWAQDFGWSIGEEAIFIEYPDGAAEIVPTQEPTTH